MVQHLRWLVARCLDIVCIADPGKASVHDAYPAGNGCCYSGYEVWLRDFLKCRRDHVLLCTYQNSGARTHAVAAAAAPVDDPTLRAKGTDVVRCSRSTGATAPSHLGPGQPIFNSELLVIHFKTQRRLR